MSDLEQIVQYFLVMECKYVATYEYGYGINLMYLHMEEPEKANYILGLSGL